MDVDVSAYICICTCIKNFYSSGYADSDRDFEKAANTDMFLKCGDRCRYPHMDEFSWIQISTYVKNLDKDTDIRTWIELFRYGHPHMNIRIRYPYMDGAF